MARVTVEDCIEKISNRFDLVLVASRRARSISSGDQLTIERDNDKNPVVALREIADETISTEDVQADLISSLQRMKQREEEQTAIDEASNVAEDGVEAFNADPAAGALTDGEDGGAMQIDSAGDSAQVPDAAEDQADGSFSDIGSFSDEAADKDEAT